MSAENILFSFSAAQAEKHFAEGLYQIFTYGDPCDNRDEMQRYLRRKYQVELYWTGGCCQTVENTEKLEEYSDRMKELLIQKFGRDIFDEADEATKFDLSEVRFFADGGCSAVWTRNGYSCRAEDITGKPEELDERIQVWADRYDTEIEGVLTGIGPCIVASPEVRQKFNADGLSLAKEFLNLLPPKSRLFYIPVSDKLTGGEAVEVFRE